VSACSSGASGGSNGGGPNGGGSNGGGSDTGGNLPANSAEGFEGSLATSGKYAATWTASPDAEADVFNSVSSVPLTSDHQTFGTITVQPDGSMFFTSGAAELSPNLSFKGTGATVTMDKTNRFVCAISVDSDLAGTRDSAVLHLKGVMRVNWHPQGIGDANCP
jgi:hypothetical protein